LLWIAGSVIAEHWWPCAAVAYLPQLQFGAPTAVLIAWAALKRDMRASAISALAAVVFLFGPMDLRVRLPRDFPPEERLRVMTYNIRGGTWNLDRAIATIRAADPDVVCLQEARTNSQAGTNELERKVREGLRGYVGHREESIMTLARSQIVEFGHERLMVGRHSRPLVRARIRHAGSAVTVCNVHFVLSEPVSSARRTGLRTFVERAVEVRRDQAEALIKATRRDHRPMIVCGDFNTPPRGVVYGMLAGEWEDAAYVRSGFGYTFASTLPVLRIDYIWHSPDLLATRTETPASTGSDHRPVVADLIVIGDRLTRR